MSGGSAARRNRRAVLAGVALIGGVAILSSGILPRLGSGPDRGARPVSPDLHALPRDSRSFPIRGVSLEAPRRPFHPARMAEVADLGANWVAVIPYAFIRSESGEVLFDRDGQYWGERDAGVRRQVDQARAHGMKVLLKPHVWWRGESGWAGDYLPGSEEEWGRWERSYREYVLGAARLASELGLEMFCVGTELSRLVDARPEYFRRLIDDVREVYDGPLTYAANWDAYRRTPLWDLLDYIGIDAYFPLSSAEDAGVGELEREWEPIVEELRRLALEHDRPILFTEFGYRSVVGAAGEQWLLPPEGRTDPALLDEGIQARAYEALFRSWWEEPWLAGGFFWEWHLAEGGGEEVASRGSSSDGSDRAGLRRATGFTPEGKAAEGVIRTWYHDRDAAGR